MPKGKVTISFVGGKADKPIVSADDFAQVILNFQRAIRIISKNLALQEEETDTEKVELHSTLIVSTPAQKGSLKQVLEIPDLSPDPPAGKHYGLRSTKAFVEGQEKIRKSIDEMPLGFNREIMTLIDSNSEILSHGYEKIEYDFSFDDTQINSVYDQQIGEKIRERWMRKEEIITGKVAGLSLEGILFALSDKEFSDPKAPILANLVNPWGETWECVFPRKEFENLKNAWDQRVFVSGEATYLKTKKKVMVQSFKILSTKKSALDAFSEFAKLNKGLWEKMGVDKFISTVREGDGKDIS